MGFQTDAIHAGQKPDAATGAIMTPIFQTSTFVQEQIGKHKGYEYARTGNPTRTAMEKNIATLEKSEYGIAFGSGMAAINAIMALLKQGDHVIVTNNVYGGTYRLFEKVFVQYGLFFTYVDSSDINQIEQSYQKNTKMVFIETPTNPMLTLAPLKEIAQFAKSKRIISVVDNTFMSPYFQNPVEFGIDLVVHSSTKYLNGHSDVVGGIVLTSKDELAERLYFVQNAAGAVPGPMDCWLILRATKTLALRMREHDKNAQAVSKFLSVHPKIRKIFYPGLETHPQYRLACEQMRGFGGIVSFELGTLENAQRFAGAVKIFSLAESLGGVESLVDHPAIMTHASVPEDDRLKLGITDGLIRLSVGIEDKEDLVEDLDQALKKVK